MDEKTLKRRAWIKNATIIFLALMLVLTLFSNTIMNYSLPEVSTQHPASGMITTRINASGTIESTDNFLVSATAARTIKSVEIKTGMTVSIGDVLFNLEEGTSADLTKAKYDYNSAKIEYEKLLLTQGADYTAEQKAIDAAELALEDEKEKLAQAKEALDGLPQSAARLEAAKEAVKTAQAKVDEVTEMIAAYSAEKANKYDVNGLTLEQRISYAKADEASALNALRAIETTLNNTKSALSYAEATVKQLQTSYDNANGAFEQYKGKSMDELYPDLYAAGKDAELIKSQLTGSITKLLGSLYSAYISAADGSPEKAAAKELYDKTYAASIAPDGHDADYRTLVAAATYNDNFNEIEDFQVAYKNAMLQYNNKKTGYEADFNLKKASMETNVNAINSQLSAAKTNVTSVSDNLTQIQKEYDDAKTKADSCTAEVKKLTNTAALDTLNDQKSEAQEVLDKATKELEKAQKNAELTKEDAEKNVKTAQRSVKTAESTLKSAKEDLDKKKATETLDSKKATLDLQVKKDELTEMENNIKSLEEKLTDNTIKAKVAGVISTVNCSAGQNISAGMTLCEIQQAEKGYVINFTVTVDQAKRIKVGDAAKLQYYWGGDISATVASIKNDPQNLGKNKLITLNVFGDEIFIGQQLNFSLGEKGTSYDTIVPTTAIREDNNGKFILVVEEKSTPLGNRYKAVRTDISVITSDDKQTAITAGITGDAHIITTTSKPISDGDLVRLVNN